MYTQPAVNNPALERQRAVAQNYANLRMDSMMNYTNKRAGDWITAANLLYGNARDIYYKSEDPREEASKKMFVDSVRESLPGLSEEYLYNNYKGIIKQATGADLSADGLFDVFGQKVAEGYRSFASGVAAIGFELENLLAGNSEDTYDKEKRQERQDEFLSSISGKVRTDYYNEYDGFVQKAILGLGDTLPSLMNSVPAMLGAVVTGVSGNPLFMTAGRGISDVLNFTMEYGSLLQSLRGSGATPAQMLTAAGFYATISTAIEHNFDKIPENFLAKPFGQWLRLYKDVDGLGTRQIANSVAKVFANRLINTGASWLSETGEEMFQQLAEDWTVNLLSKYRENVGHGKLPDYLTSTKEKMVADFIETGKSMGTTQTLLSVASMILGLGFDASFGNIRSIVNANKYTARSKNADIRFASELLRSQNPQNVAEGVREAIKGRSTSAFGFIPDTKEGADYAGYVFNKGKRNTLYTEQNTDEIKGEAATREQSIAIVNDIIEKDSKGNKIDVQITEDGKLKVAGSQLSEVVRSFIYSHYDSYQGISENTDGSYDVVLDGTKYTFTGSDITNGKTVTANDIVENLGIDRAAQEYDENRRKTIERRAESFRGAMDEYVSKDSDQKRTEFLSSARDSLIRQGYSGERLNAQMDAVNRMVTDNEQSLNGIAQEFENRGVLVRGTDASEFTRSISNGIASTVVKLSRRFGKDVEWAAKTIKLDTKPIQGVYYTETEDGGLEKTSIWGKSYWSDGSIVDGKLRKYQDYSEITDKDKAEFHIAVSDLVDQTTGAHETAHMFLSLGSESLINDEKFRKAFYNALSKDNEGKAEKGWKIGKETHEAFAEGLEAYINNGIADSEEKVSIFRSVLNAVRDIWRSISEFLTKDQLDFYDRLLGDSTDTIVTETDGLSENSSESVENSENMSETDGSEEYEQMEAEDERYKRTVERVSFDKDASEGRVLNYREVTRYIGESDWARAEKDAARIDADGSLQWVETELRKAIKDYLDGDRFVYSDFTDSDWEKVTKRWMDAVTQRLSKDKTKVDVGSDPVKVAKRLVVYITNTSADSGIREWLNKYTGKNGKAGDNNMLKLARKMEKNGLFSEKMSYGNNQEISRRFPYMNLILTEDRRSKKSFRTEAAEIIWERAEKEIENNARELYELDQRSVWNSQADRMESAEVDDNVVVEGEYANLTENDVRKARNEAQKAREYVSTVQEEIDKLAFENETLKNNVNQMFSSLEDLADRFGIDRAEYTNLGELVDAIMINGAAYEEVTGRLMSENVQQAIDYENTIQENSDRINELRDEIKDRDNRIHDMEVENRRKQRKIDRQIDKIDELTDKLKDQKKLSDKEYSELEKKYNKAILDYDSLKGKSEDAQKKLVAARQKLKSLERSNANTESKLKQTEYTLMAVSKALDNTFSRLEKAISEKNHAQKRMDEAVQKYNTLRANTITANARRDMRKRLEHNSGDADNQRAMRAFAKGFFQRDTDKDPFKSFVITDQMLKAMPKTIAALSGAEMSYVIKDGKNKGNVVVAMDENGNVAHLDLIRNGVAEEGFTELPLRYYPFIKAAINEDIEKSSNLVNEREKQRKEEVQSLNNSIAGTFADVKLTKTQQKEAEQMVIDGKANDMSEARKKVFEKEADTAHEGTEYLKTKQRKGFGIRNNLAFVSFESLYNLFGKINKKLRDAFFFGYTANVTDENGKTVDKRVSGINTVTDNYLRGKNSRLSKLQNEVVDLLGGKGKTDKQREKIFDKWQRTAHETVETRHLSEDMIPESLLNNQTFMDLLYEEQDDGELVARYDPDMSFVDNNLTVQEVMAIYEHAKSTSTDIGHLIGERTNISPYQIAYIVDQFEREDGEFHQYQDIANAYQRAYEERFDDIARISNELYGISLNKVDVYSPLNRAQDNQDTDVSMAYMFNQNGQIQPQREGTALGERSFQQQRAGGDTSISLQYVSDFGRVVQSQEYFVAGAEFFKLWNDILKNSGGNLRSTIQSNYGFNVADAIIKNIKACSGADFSDIAGGMNGLVNTLRNNMALANLGFSVSSTLQQPAVWFLGAGKYGYGNMLSVTLDIKRKYGSISNFIKHVHELSPQIAEMQNVQIAYAHQALNTNGFMKGLRSVAEWGMKGIEWLDQINRCILFEAAYNHYSEGDMTETQIVEKATQDVMNMNSSRQAKDNALLYNSKSPYWRALLMFTNQLNKQWNMFIGEDGIDALHERRIKEFIGTMVGLGLASTWVLLAKGKLVNNPGDDDKWFLDLMKDYGTEWAEMVPVVGDMFASAVNGYSYLDSNIVSSMVTLVKRVASDDEKKGSKIVTASKNVTKDFMTLIGAPKYIFSNTYNALVENGEWAGDRLFEDARILRLFMPYEWYEFFTNDIFK